MVTGETVAEAEDEAAVGVLVPEAVIVGMSPSPAKGGAENVALAAEPVFSARVGGMDTELSVMTPPTPDSETSWSAGESSWRLR